MATNRTDVKIPTSVEFIDYLHAISELISHRLLCINGYEPNWRYEFTPCDYELHKVQEWKTIVSDFMKKYPNISIYFYTLCFQILTVYYK